MSVSYLTSTVPETLTITNGPQFNDLAFQGWFIHTENSSSLQAVNCANGQSLFTTTVYGTNNQGSTTSNRYAQCCPIGAVTCTTFATGCANVTLQLGALTSTCPLGYYCETLSIYDEYPISDGAQPDSQLICANNQFTQHVIFRTVLDVVTTSSVTVQTITASPSPSSSPSAKTASKTSSATGSSSPVPTPIPSTSKAWIAGAVIGPIAAVAIAALAIFLLRRRRSRRDAGNPSAVGLMAGSGDAEQKYDSGSRGPSAIYPSGQWSGQKDGTIATAEMEQHDAQRAPHELSPEAQQRALFELEGRPA